MKDRTKRFLMDGVLMVGIFLIIGSIWAAISSNAPKWEKILFLVWASGIVFIIVYQFYKEIIKTGEGSLTHGTFCEIDAFFVDGKPRQDFFEEAVSGMGKINDIIFFTDKNVEDGKKLLRKLTLKSYPVIPIDQLYGKKIEVIICNFSQRDLERLNIRTKYHIYTRK